MSATTRSFSDAALVVGGGIAGMQAALDLAAMSYPVILLESSPSIGGNMARLDKTFPTNDCSTCMLSPKMVACSRHPLIRILTLAELVDLDGSPGRFIATVRQHPRYVDETVCIGCRMCVEKCPRRAPNEYNGGLDERKSIHFAQAQAIPPVPSIDAASCIFFQKGRCRACEKVCPVQAIRLEDKARELQLPVGAVILSAGYEPALVANAGEYGHGRYPNVVTGLEYERMLSATGPYEGHVRRPSDGRKARKVAWIQCVASRDSARNRNFCSSVCCMAAVKQAVLTRDHDPESETVLFYMDIRAQGKDFDRYVLRAREQHGVRFVRSMLSQVLRNPLNENLLLQYYDRDAIEQNQEEFDLVVLSAGMKPADKVVPLLERLGIERNRYGFVAPDLRRPSHTSREGILVCGALDGPRDIPESVTGAGAAAAGAAAILAEYRESRTGDAGPAAESRDITGEPPRVGVFVCHCGRNIAGVVDVESLRDHVSSLPNVATAEHFLFTCSTQTQDRIREIIEDRRLNRVVVAACSPRTHEPLFRETLRQAGLNPYLFEMANIRDQCSWVHGGEPEAATRKAKSLVDAAVSRAVLLAPVTDVVTKVVRRALVIGGGLAGMTAALTLADQSIPVLLVEKSPRLGGMAREIYRTLEGHSPRQLAEDLAQRVKMHRHITLYAGAAVSRIDGGPGNFSGEITEGGSAVPVEFGAVIVATGGEPYRPTEYLYGSHPAVVTQIELEKRIFLGGKKLPEKTVMIQCVGSRREDFALCSRLCCSAAVKNSIAIMERSPSAAVYVLYRDIRTFGFKEDYYKKARDLGAVFIPFEPESPPEVEIEGDRLQVRFFDPTSGMHLELNPDLVVLSAGVRPRPEAAAVGKMLKAPMMQEGFFMEAHPKLSPLDFSTLGIYLCGLAHSPRFMEESLTQACGAACRAAGLLLRDSIHTSGAVAEVDRRRCSACLVCVHSCPYQVPSMDAEGISFIDPRKCQGCGICAAECPAKAIAMKHYTDEQLNAQAKGAVRRQWA